MLAATINQLINAAKNTNLNKSYGRKTLVPVKVMCVCGNAAGNFVYMRQCRCQAHVYAAMPLASSCYAAMPLASSCYAAMPLASSCICGNAAGNKFMYTRQCRWQVHGKFMYVRQCRWQVHVWKGGGDRGQATGNAASGNAALHCKYSTYSYIRWGRLRLAAFSLAAMPQFMAAMPRKCERQCRMNEASGQIEGGWGKGKSERQCRPRAAMPRGTARILHIFYIRGGRVRVASNGLVPAAKSFSARHS